jgi:hypothetical protein
LILEFFWADSGFSVASSAAKGGVFATAPGIPWASGSLVVSWVACSLLIAEPSGSTTSSVIFCVVKSTSTLTCAVILPAPNIGVNKDITLCL